MQEERKGIQKRVRIKRRNELFEHLKNRLENGWPIIEDPDSSLMDKLRKDGIDFETVIELPYGPLLARKIPELKRFLRDYSCLLSEYGWRTIALARFVKPVGEIRKSAFVRTCSSQWELTGLILHILELSAVLSELLLQLVHPFVNHSLILLYHCYIDTTSIKICRT